MKILFFTLLILTAFRCQSELKEIFSKTISKNDSEIDFAYIIFEGQNSYIFTTGTQDSGDSFLRSHIFDLKTLKEKQITLQPEKDFPYSRLLNAFVINSAQIGVLGVDDKESVFLHIFTKNGETIFRKLIYDFSGFYNPEQSFLYQKTNIVVAGSFTKGVFLEKRDLAGNLIWSKTFQLSQPSQVTSLKEAINGKIVFCFNEGEQTKFGVYGKTFRIIEVNGAGDKLFESKMEGWNGEALPITNDIYGVASRVVLDKKTHFKIAKWNSIKKIEEEMSRIPSVEEEGDFISMPIFLRLNPSNLVLSKRLAYPFWFQLFDEKLHSKNLVKLERFQGMLLTVNSYQGNLFLISTHSDKMENKFNRVVFTGLAEK